MSATLIPVVDTGLYYGGKLGSNQFAVFNGSMHRLAEQSVTVVLGLYSFEEGVI